MDESRSTCSALERALLLRCERVGERMVSMVAFGLSSSCAFSTVT